MVLEQRIPSWDVGILIRDRDNIRKELKKSSSDESDSNVFECEVVCEDEENPESDVRIVYQDGREASGREYCGFDFAFAPDAPWSNIFHDIVDPMILDFWNGASCTFVNCGMPLKSLFIQNLAETIFGKINHALDSSGSVLQFGVFVQILDVAGHTIIDKLSPGSSTKVAIGSEGKIYPEVTEIEVQSEIDLRDLIIQVDKNNTHDPNTTKPHRVIKLRLERRVKITNEGLVSRSHSPRSSRHASIDETVEYGWKITRSSFRLVQLNLSNMNPVKNKKDQHNYIETSTLDKESVQTLASFCRCIRDAGRGFRDSKLTHLLQDAFSKDTRCTLCANVLSRAKETLYTAEPIKFAMRVLRSRRSNAAGLEPSSFYLDQNYNFPEEKSSRIYSAGRSSKSFDTRMQTLVDDFKSYMNDASLNSTLMKDATRSVSSSETENFEDMRIRHQRETLQKNLDNIGQGQTRNQSSDGLGHERRTKQSDVDEIEMEFSRRMARLSNRVQDLASDLSQTRNRSLSGEFEEAQHGRHTDHDERNSRSQRARSRSDDYDNEAASVGSLTHHTYRVVSPLSRRRRSSSVSSHASSVGSNHRNDDRPPSPSRARTSSVASSSRGGDRSSSPLRGRTTSIASSSRRENRSSSPPRAKASSVASSPRLGNRSSSPPRTAPKSSSVTSSPRRGINTQSPLRVQTSASVASSPRRGNHPHSPTPSHTSSVASSPRRNGSSAPDGVSYVSSRSVSTPKRTTYIPRSTASRLFEEEYRVHDLKSQVQRLRENMNSQRKEHAQGYLKREKLIEKLEEELTQLEAENSMRESSNVELRSMLSKKNREIADLESALESLEHRASSQELSRHTQREIESIYLEQVEQLKEEVRMEQRALAALQDELVKDREEIALLKSEKKDLELQVESLIFELKNSRRLYENSTHDEVYMLKSKITLLENQLDAKDIFISNLDADIDHLRGVGRGASHSGAIRHEQVIQLKELIHEKNEEIYRLQGLCRELDYSNEKICMELESANRNIGMLRDALHTFGAEEPERSQSRSSQRQDTEEESRSVQYSRHSPSRTLGSRTRAVNARASYDSEGGGTNRGLTRALMERDLEIARLTRKLNNAGY